MKDLFEFQGHATDKPSVQAQLPDPVFLLDTVKPSAVQFHFRKKKGAALLLCRANSTARQLRRSLVPAMDAMRERKQLAAWSNKCHMKVYDKEP